MSNSTIIEPERFMVVGLGVWGRGNTLKEARANALKELGRGVTNAGKLIAYAGSSDLALENGYATATQLIRLGEI